MSVHLGRSEVGGRWSKPRNCPKKRPWTERRGLNRMSRMTKLRHALFAILLAQGSAASAIAQSPQKLPGSWYAADNKFGLVVEKGDGEPHFAYGECDRRQLHPRAKLTLEIDPKFFGDAITASKYVIVRWADDRSKGDLIADGISLNEAGPFLWSLLMTINLDTLNHWLSSSYLVLTIGVREPDGSGFRSTHSYIMPEENRQKALASFIRSCFEGQHK